MHEPIAIVGIGVLWPGARGVDEFWNLLTGPSPASSAVLAVQPPIDLAKFRVPPAQANILPRLQLAMFDVAAQCLTDASHPARALPTASTDVLVATCGGLDRHYANAARICAVHYADTLERLLEEHYPGNAAGVADEFADSALAHLGAAPHDRVGEMTSSIPARIAAAYGFRGRCMAMESADTSAVLALGQAVIALRARSSDAVLVLAGRVDHEHTHAFAAKKTGRCSSPPKAGVIGLLLKRSEDAARDGDRSYASVRTVITTHAGRRGTFRRPSADTVAASPSGENPGHLEPFGPGTRFGSTFAADPLGAVAAVALGLHHRRRPVPGTPAWPSNQPTGAVTGTSLYGTAVHVLLDEGRPNRGAPSRSTARESPEPIAVLASAGQFAGALDIDQFWAATTAPSGQFSKVSEYILDRRLFHNPTGMSLRHSYTLHGAPLSHPRSPPGEMRMVPARYAMLDVAQRVALEVATDLFTRRITTAALRGSGLVAIGTTLALTRDRELGAHGRLAEFDELVRGLPTLAVLSTAERDELVKLVHAELDLADGGEASASPYLLDGILAGGIPALIANEFELTATPVAIEAACASSLAAIDVAVGALRSGTADFAVAGGVEIVCTTRDFVLCSALRLLSATLITPFDVAADGFTPGDGCGLFVLKRLHDAEQNGDQIAAVLRGVGASNDAKSLIAPDVDGQELAMRRAYAGLGVDPLTVDYVEAHGTGTIVGDRVEVEALSRVYGGRTPEHPLALGTAKGSFGHTFAAAGAAGLLRVLDALRRRTVPPTAQVHNVHPGLCLDTIPARIPTRPEVWPPPVHGPRRAAVSSFGTGGINYHLVVEEYQ